MSYSHKVSNLSPTYTKYVFNFTSLITPHKITNIRLLNTVRPFKSKKYKKIFTKQSYLLMTWLWYTQKQNSNSTQKPSFAFKPTKTSKTTLIKAPMAHKTFSQEQFKFRFFSLIISFHVPNSLQHSTVNQLLYVILSLKSAVPFVETNFFLLKKFICILTSSDSRFFKL